jgi:predicted ATPase
MSGLTEKVSDWLSDEDKLDTGYAVELQEHKRLDLSTQAARKLLSGRAFDEVTDDLRAELVRIPTITQLAIVPKGTGLMLRPQDVGTGISQVLPVVVTALDGEQRLLAVEQPELHLHPRVQAELADLFIEAALGAQRHQVVLETHSELIPLRIMRRLRECHAGKADTARPAITSDDVHVAYVETHEGATILTTLELGKDGSLLDPWPDGFFEEGFNERFGG